MAKSALPLLLMAGVAVVALKPKKKKKSTAAVSPPPKLSKDNVLAGDSVARVFPSKTGKDLSESYEWRVRKSSDDYIAEVGKINVRSQTVKVWTEVGKADNLEDAKDLAFAYIDKQPGFEYASTAVKSSSHQGFDLLVRTAEYTETEGDQGFSGTKEENVHGFIGEYRLEGESKWTPASKGRDMEAVRLLTLEAATIARDALTGDPPPKVYPPHMMAWMAVCEGDVAMQDMGNMGIVPYCPTAKSGQTVASGSSEDGLRIWRIQKTANPASPYVVQNNLSAGHNVLAPGDWEHADNSTNLTDAIIIGANSII